MLRHLAFLVCILAVSPAFAQTDSTQLSRLLSDFRIKTSVGLQLWASYSQNMEIFDAESSSFERVDNRLNLQLRRSRFSISGQPYRTVKFKVTAALDLVGHDVLAATEAGGNNGSSPNFRIWNAHASWQLIPDSDLLHLTAGYFVAPIGRESNTAALRSNSFEKAWSQNYLRRHLTGIGPGRAMGLMLGGQAHNGADNKHLTYEIALQNPVFAAFAGNSTGAEASPLLSGRLSLHFGEAESEVYSMSHRVNYFGKRKGLTISLAAAQQGRTDCFSSNGAYGVEVLYNTPAFHLDGEYFFLHRAADVLASSPKVKATTGYARLGSNISLPRQLVLEPVVSYWFFRGAESIAEIAAATSLESFAGGDDGLDVGANLYFNPNTKLSLFYAYRAGSSGEGQAELINNNFYRQPGVGSVQRGSYVGAGWVIMF